MENMTKPNESEIPVSVYHCVKGFSIINKNGCDGCGGLSKPEIVYVPQSVVRRDAEGKYLMKRGFNISGHVVCSEKKPF